MNSALEIFVYGDSLGLPRVKNNISAPQTYAELFRLWAEKNKKDKRIYLYNRSQGAIRIRHLLELIQMDSAYFGNTCEKIMILHCGIVDCAPRPVPDWLRDFISRLPATLQNPVIKFLHDNRPNILKSGFFWRATPPAKFKWLYKNALKSALEVFSRVYVINIFPTTEDIEKHSPGLNKSIALYNDLIKETITSTKADNLFFIDIHKIISDGTHKLEKVIDKADGHHLTLEGHRLLYDLLIERELNYRLEN